TASSRCACIPRRRSPRWSRATATSTGGSRRTARCASAPRMHGSRCCIRGITTTTSCCAPSSPGATPPASAARRRDDDRDGDGRPRHSRPPRRRTGNAPENRPRGGRLVMLSLIRVKNFAVIDEVEVELGAGLSVVTGETGAGKSILVDALGLALGDRADTGVVRHGADRAEVSVLFECPPGHAALAWLEELGLDDEQRCALRRVVSHEGRSRAFVNNHPVTLADLRHVGSLLVDIHGQHAHQSLLDGANQRALLDAHGGLGELVSRVAAAYRAWQQARARLEQAQGGHRQRDAELELLRFQAAELEALALEDGEPARLHAERGRLANVDKLAGGLELAIQALYEAESASAHALVARAGRELERLIEHDEALRGPAEALASAEIELRETALALLRYRDQLEPDPERLEAVEARLTRIRALARRHGVDEDELPGVLDRLRARIDELDGAGHSIEALREAAERAQASYF